MKQVQFRSNNLLLPIILAAVLLSAGCSRNDSPAGHKEPGVEYFFEIYPQVQKTELSNLGEKLTTIVKKRLECYEEKFAVGDRIKECQKDYLIDLVTTARTNIKSAPMLGEAAMAFKRCPIIYAMCRGDAEGVGKEECVEVEVKAIEHMLDQYWRGATIRSPRSSSNL